MSSSLEQSLLLTVPAEIRLIIYQHYFESLNIEIAGRSCSNNLRSPSSRELKNPHFATKSPDYLHRQNIPNLLLTHPMLYNETKMEFMKHVTVSVETSTSIVRHKMFRLLYLHRYQLRHFAITGDASSRNAIAMLKNFCGVTPRRDGSRLRIHELTVSEVCRSLKWMSEALLVADRIYLTMWPSEDGVVGSNCTPGRECEVSIDVLNDTVIVQGKLRSEVDSVREQLIASCESLSHSCFTLKTGLRQDLVTTVVEPEIQRTECVHVGCTRTMDGRAESYRAWGQIARPWRAGSSAAKLQVQVVLIPA